MAQSIDHLHHRRVRCQGFDMIFGNFLTRDCPNSFCLRCYQVSVHIDKVSKKKYYIVPNFYPIEDRVLSSSNGRNLHLTCIECDIYFRNKKSPVQQLVVPDYPKRVDYKPNKHYEEYIRLKNLGYKIYKNPSEATCFPKLYLG